jgi:hypothetical protein
MSTYCAHCGAPQPELAKYCPSCGKEVASADPPTAQRRRNRRQSHPASVVILAVVVVVAFLYLLNNTAVGLSVKCHLFDDVGACLVESVTVPGSVQDILNKIGNDV